MATKLVKSTVVYVGIISAISAIPFLGGMPANAQTGSPQVNDSLNETNQQPSQLNQSPSQLNQPLNQPSQNTTTTPSNGTSGTSGFSNNQNPVLSLGSRGEEVRQAQTLLQQQGLYNGPIDGVYGLQTRNAVRAFQRSKNLVADGVIGTNTWSVMLNPQNQASSNF